MFATWRLTGDSKYEYEKKHHFHIIRFRLSLNLMNFLLLYQYIFILPLALLNPLCTMNAYAPEQNYLCARRVRSPSSSARRAPRRVSINLKAAPPYLCDANCLYVPPTHPLSPSPSPCESMDEYPFPIWEILRKSEQGLLKLPSHDTEKSDKFNVPSNRNGVLARRADDKNR